MVGESGVEEERDSTKGSVAKRAAMGRRRKARMVVPRDGEIVRRNGEGSKKAEKQRIENRNQKLEERRRTVTQRGRAATKGRRRSCSR
jgi:hypothetical protein